MGLADANRRSPRPPRASHFRSNAKPTKTPPADPSPSAVPCRPHDSKAVELRFRIASDFNRGNEVQEEILDAIQRVGFTANSTFAVKLALDEAMVNAIKHGNRLDLAKHVLVEAKVSAERVDITIEDEGLGFVKREVPDPTHEDNLHKCSGRGILLIESYMNSARWDRGGRRLRMIRCNEEDELPSRPSESEV